MVMGWEATQWPIRLLGVFLALVRPQCTPFMAVHGGSTVFLAVPGWLNLFMVGSTSFLVGVTGFPGGVTGSMWSLTSFPRGVTSFPRGVTGFLWGVTGFLEVVTGLLGGASRLE